MIKTDILHILRVAKRFLVTRNNIIFNVLCLLYRTRLFENIRMLPHAPGVQMQGR